MVYNVAALANFKKEAKRLIKKYPSLKSELLALRAELMERPHLGIPIGDNTYKIRLSIESKGKGKSGGARVITFVYLSIDTVFLLCIYDKSEKEAIKNIEIQQLIKRLINE